MRIKVHATSTEHGVSLTREFGQEWSAAAWMQAMRTLYGPKVHFDIRTTVRDFL